MPPCVGIVERDVVVYGSTPAAITAAIEAQAMGRTVVIVSPERRIGGLTTGGLGATDVGDKSAYGGLALKFYRDIRTYYSNHGNWRWQKPEDYSPRSRSFDTSASDSMWFFEPSAALKVLCDWEKDEKLDIRRCEFLDRGTGGVKVKDGRIIEIRTLGANVYRGKVFVDATYEGDLMAASGVGYFVGREGNSVYNETNSGFQPMPSRGGNKLKNGIDPYLRKGDPSSGLLPGVLPYKAVENRAVGSGDAYVQAYNIRMCLTDRPENRVPFAKPAGYDEREYELLFRNFEAGETDLPRNQGIMPNGKTDTNNHGGFSSDFIGRNWSWPEATYDERDGMAAAHLRYQQGLMWTLANHPRVPEPVRAEFSKWGTCRDELADAGMDGWQRVIYVREARRMVGEYVVTEHDCRGERVAARPIALASYGMDSHNVMRYVGADGFVHNEGDIQDWRARGVPYPIDYGAIVPKRGECANLFVPVCVSASHMAFGSVRMEPVFFELGQAAGAAAAIAIEDGVAVQDVDYAKLSHRLVGRGQYLFRKSCEDNPVVRIKANVPTIVVDDDKITDVTTMPAIRRTALQIGAARPPAILVAGGFASRAESPCAFREAMRRFGRELRTAVDEVSPDTRMGVCVTSHGEQDVDALVAFARELAGPGRPFVCGGRECGGQILPHADFCSCCGKSAWLYQNIPADFETYVDLDAHTGARCTNAVNMAEAIAFAHTALGVTGVVRSGTKSWDARLRILREELRGRHVRGVQLAYRHLRGAGRRNGESPTLVEGASFLGRAGFPFTTDEMPWKILVGTDAELLSDADIARILNKGGLLVDAEAVDIFRRRGFGDLMGRPVEDAAIADAATLFENAKGGRLAVLHGALAAEGQRLTCSAHGNERLRTLFSWLGRQELHAVVANVPDVMIFCSTDNEESELVITAVSLRTEDLSAMGVILAPGWRGLPIEEASERGEWEPSTFAKKMNPGCARVFRIRKTAVGLLNENSKATTVKERMM